ncbi:hypothetical protein HYFRA_00001289 [Hymenoscyphus fraxineus]|uniref:Uncharacterized protein n=1 Tax=Hymenoscyphus fraxineus TaxID=746836 RepID=A0A9N9PTQ3_9HELO|nr:hypothetical protein HYFRA_00001289 [Hymenoscyphus fraxineus]
MPINTELPQSSSHNSASLPTMLSDDAIINLVTSLISIAISLFGIWQRSHILADSVLGVSAAQAAVALEMSLGDRITVVYLAIGS